MAAPTISTTDPVITGLALPAVCATYYANFVATGVAASLLADFTKRFANESRRHVVNPETDQTYKLSRRTLVLVEPAQLDELSLVIPKIWGDNVTVLPFTPEAETLRQHIQELTGCVFNICLVNYHASGSDTIGFHSDQEERGSTSCIASVSLGAERSFAFRRTRAAALQDMQGPGVEYDLPLVRRDTLRCALVTLVCSAAILHTSASTEECTLLPSP